MAVTSTVANPAPMAHQVLVASSRDSPARTRSEATASR
ncbi:hypothetical protein K530_54130 [Streptomyces noursei CCRC 11814]|nr:hypothetical protein K530_54130 [Streptomyces noursei CCRC 11814]